MRIRTLVGVTLTALGLWFAAAANAESVTKKHITDTFAGPTIDQNVWAFWGGSDAVSISQEHGGLTFAIDSGAPNDFGSSLTTRCAASGDFDARLAFDLPQWTLGNGVW